MQNTLQEKYQSLTCCIYIQITITRGFNRVNFNHCGCLQPALAERGADLSFFHQTLIWYKMPVQAEPNPARGTRSDEVGTEPVT